MSCFAGSQICSNIRLISASISWKSASTRDRYGRTAILTFFSSFWRFSRIASRKSRLIRFLLAAMADFPCRKTPQRKSSLSFQIRRQNFPFTFCPLFKRSEISTLLLRLQLRGSLFAPGNSCRQPLSAFGPAATEHFTPAGGGRTLTEPVIV